VAQGLTIGLKLLPLFPSPTLFLGHLALLRTWEDEQQIEMNPDQLVWVGMPLPEDDGTSPIASLRCEPVVTRLSGHETPQHLGNAHHMDSSLTGSVRNP
jgi:hypothetical protein